ncbi:hypothetical protein [Flagellimonas sp.]|uniref:hypothetical protein n=1 Tax=Flagellimonas sp. TaxID=2058762 RepID=UPI003BABF793
MRKTLTALWCLLALYTSAQAQYFQDLQDPQDYYLISDGEVGIFQIGQNIPFEKAKKFNFDIRKEIQTEYFDEGSEDITIYIVSKNKKDLLKITSEFDYSSRSYTTRISAIEVLSKEFRTQENIGLGTTIETFIKAYPDSQIWYSYMNDSYFLETNDKIEFHVKPEAYQPGEVDFISDLTKLNISDFNLQSTIESIRLTTVWHEQYLKDFTYSDDLKKENLLAHYTKFDFSKIWNQTTNDRVWGIIGEDYQRIKIKLLSIEQDPKKQSIYHVKGKSNVKGNICDFQGTIRLKKVFELKEESIRPQSMLDDGWKMDDVKDRGVLIADYVFYENESQKHSGFFKGFLYSKWYLDWEDQIKYDDYEVFLENNPFIGTWTSYATGKSKICNWGDFHVPDVGDDFNVGAGEFFPNKKYDDKGWGTINKAWLDDDNEAKKIELEEWWKN